MIELTFAESIFLVLFIGVLSMIISRRTGISYIPIFILAGMLIGPVLNLIPRSLAHSIFDFVRVFGLVIILFTEGHNLSWKILRKNFGTIATLDTVGLLITAIIAGFIFEAVFHSSFLLGFLFGAIIGATDPATLIPLFRQYRVRQDIETVIVTESIFNDPLGIVLTLIAVSMLIPGASGGLFSELSARVGVYGAGIIYFLYNVAVSIGIGILLGVAGYKFIKATKIYDFPEIEAFSLSLAFLGFFIGERLEASGYLVATVTGIILGNYKVLKPREDVRVLKRIQRAIEKEVHFNDTLAALATIFIFVVLGAEMNLQVIASNLGKGLLVALGVMLVARPLATLPILKWWSPREYLFIALEGPRGVVPSALASLPLSLALKYHEGISVYWGEIIMAVVVVTVLASVILETLWLPILKDKLGVGETVEERIKRKEMEKKKKKK
ncbi:sodium:proton antiporter [Thermococcus chitonophagus]|uniref:Na+/H+ antiporter n=1 Tax=Thermococcus chitonophagus TaxID=54262 RepID=A0A160VT06_9EURY|nr:sodium:proton antiporter [Thermococcus chitonophagus]ASJ17383.1 sodium:proton antiporter [Thermococcus chitonophagus]CUX78020.1 Na+/H+ antiporter [Thermococcus chitonophagus]